MHNEIVGPTFAALMRELHARLPPGSSYVLLVAEANTDAREFYERHGLIVERRLDGPSHYSSAMGLDVHSSTCCRRAAHAPHEEQPDAVPADRSASLIRATKVDGVY